MFFPTFWTTVTEAFATSIPFHSFFEWFLHRFVMHRPVGKFRYAFEAHAVVHHHTFKADHSYHVSSEKPETKKTIPMAWWNGPVLVLITSSFLGLFGLIRFGGFNAQSLTYWLVCAFVGFCYYGAYEYIHWCMHLPKARRVEMLWIFRKLNGHHLLHHRYMHKNFNVVLPLSDLLLGTLMIRSKTRFAQARGPSVPDVQPIEKVGVPVAS